MITLNKFHVKNKANYKTNNNCKIVLIIPQNPEHETGG